MKSLCAAALLSVITLPVMAMDLTMPLPLDGLNTDVLFPGMDEFGRRSGLCPSGGARSAFREGSTCGGV